MAPASPAAVEVSAKHTRGHVGQVEYLIYKALAVAFVYLFLVTLPGAVKPYWSELLATFGGEKGLYTFGLSAFHLSILLVGNLFFLALYMGFVPFFDRFRINPGPWPWQVRVESCGCCSTAIGYWVPTQTSHFPLSDSS